MKIMVMNKKQIEDRKVIKEISFKHIIISITDPYSSKANIPPNKNCLGILKTQFYDLEKSLNIDGEIINPITKEQAQEIVNFINKYVNKIDGIIVQCQAGISRSAGIAAAISVVFNGDDTEFFEKYVPNMTCYRAILNTFGHHITDAEFFDKIENHSILKIKEKRGIYDEHYKEREDIIEKE